MFLQKEAAYFQSGVDNCRFLCAREWGIERQVKNPWGCVRRIGIEQRTAFLA